ncbi:Vegetative incompatibility protein HET-E-1 [Colletotrichum siamense]|uniref:Vegetative incompatibility protein HET-E-1 n=1 Tax=Colletotrichum siamense TaxID=690259 RepID=UPI0018724BEE|nr:Vegetative incompatibility protein HET-E-1 [Colletotrichum siamense]KAF5491531.1 Vegetative incompatibility protein HET-E-1 [Colletotrichum siamense]
MRLLPTSKLQLSEFIADPPYYAILSHTWADEEVLFSDLQADLSLKSGWAKVTGACCVAKDLGYEWIWIDTCCIDKSSSAELSEAINSMFRWYANSKICLAYIADVHPGLGQVSHTLRQSRWFTRGWTLQELLAPRQVSFYSSRWEMIGSREDLMNDITSATGIESKYLFHREHYPPYTSVAERMCWASRRETTRAEDVAYCLLGIFGVNMPLIYGEGHNAYRRLQEYIIQKVDDHSIFAWDTLRLTALDLLKHRGPITSFFAPHPKAFARAGDVVPFQTPYIRSRIKIGHDGITIDSPVWKALEQYDALRTPTCLVPLVCQYKDDPLHCIALALTFDDSHKSVGSQLYYRVGNGLAYCPKRTWVPTKLRSVFLPFKLLVESASNLERDKCIIRTLPRSYRIKRLLARHGESSFPEPGPHTAVSIDFGMTLSPSPLGREYYLGTPCIVWLKGAPDLDLILTLQLISFNPESTCRRSFLNLAESKYILYFLAYGGHASSEGIVARVKNELKNLHRWLDPDTPLDPQGAGIDMSTHILRGEPDLQQLNTSPICDLRVSVSRDPEYDPNGFLLDITAPLGFDISAETVLEQCFAPLCQAASDFNHEDGV